MNRSHFSIVRLPDIAYYILSSAHLSLTCSYNSSFSISSSLIWSSSCFIWSSRYILFFCRLSIYICHSFRLTLNSAFHFFTSFCNISIVMFICCLNSSPALIISVFSFDSSFRFLLSYSFSSFYSAFAFCRVAMDYSSSSIFCFIYGGKSYVQSIPFGASVMGSFLR